MNRIPVLGLFATSFVMLGLLSVAAAAGQIDVPGTYPTIQDGINAASPGDVIIVSGGTYAPIIIDKPLTILGNPSATIDNTGHSSTGSSVDPAVLLAGPGAGRVVLSGLEIGGKADGMIFGISGCGIEGGGFDDLWVVDCEVTSAEWNFLTGIGEGKPAILLGGNQFPPLGSLLVADSTVTGGFSDTDACDVWVSSFPPGAAAIEASGSVVTVLDSQVTGGRGPGICFTPSMCPGANPCGVINGGKGGAGVVAQTLLRAGGTVVGGAGGMVSCTGAPPCSLEDGPDATAGTIVDMGSAFQANGQPLLGGNWNFFWNTPSSLALLVFSPLPAPPISLGGKGWLFLNPSALLLFPVASGGVTYTQFSLPNDPNLVGLSIGLQIYDGSSGLTRPVIGVFQ